MPISGESFFSIALTKFIKSRYLDSGDIVSDIAQN